MVAIFPIIPIKIAISNIVFLRNKTIYPLNMQDCNRNALKYARIRKYTDDYAYTIRTLLFIVL